MEGGHGPRLGLWQARPVISQVATMVRQSAVHSDSPRSEVSHLQVNDPSLIPAVWRAPESFSVLRLESECGMVNRITKLASAPALLVSVSIKSLEIADYQLWVDDKLVPTPSIRAFRSNVVDLDTKPQCWAGRAFDYVHYHVPRKALDDIAADFAVGSVKGYKLAVAEEDLVLSQLTKSILPHIGRERAPSPLSVDYLQLLLGAHLLQRYARLQKPPRTTQAGLGPLQQRRAIELLEENLAGRVRLSDLAHECGLSISHFGRSFKASFGMSAHRWLVHRRVERTKALMAQTGESLAEIADSAGFADQAAFTRAFRRIVGVSPGRWRRDHVRPGRLRPR
jgi:AraC family transcriptional regulator